MRMKSARKLTVLDAMILVAATAAALAVMRSQWPTHLGIQDAYTDSTHALRLSNLLMIIRNHLYFASYMIAMWTLSCLILRLRQPRPALRLLTRETGMVACVAAVIVLAIRMMINFGSMISVLAIDGVYSVAGLTVLDLFPNELISIPSEIGCAVTAAWIIQAISGRWRCEPNWIDRVGRSTGAFWIATIPFSWFSVHRSG
jgi:hypothetical protein